MLHTIPLQLNLPATNGFTDLGCARTTSCKASVQNWLSFVDFSMCDNAMDLGETQQQPSNPSTQLMMPSENAPASSMMTASQEKGFSSALPTLTLNKSQNRPFDKSVVLVNRPLETIQTPEEKLQTPFQILVQGHNTKQKTALVAKMSVTNAKHESASLIASVSKGSNTAQFDEIPKFQSCDDVNASTNVQFLVYDAYGTKEQKVVGVSATSPLQLVSDANTRKSLLCKKIWKNAGGNPFAATSRMEWGVLEQELLKQCRLMLGIGMRAVQSSDLSGMTQSLRFDSKGAIDMKQFQTDVWDRVYVFTRLITQILLPLWNHNLVFGFMSRVAAEDALKQAVSQSAKDGKPKRIGLIRFSETLQSSAVIGACDVHPSGKVGAIMWAKVDLQSLQTPSNLINLLTSSNITHLVDACAKTPVALNSGVFGKYASVSGGRVGYTLFPAQKN